MAARKSRTASAGTMAALDEENVDTPAASASTPAPTIFFARLTVIDVALVPRGAGAAATMLGLSARERRVYPITCACTTWRGRNAEVVESEPEKLRNGFDAAASKGSETATATRRKTNSIYGVSPTEGPI